MGVSTKASRCLSCGHGLADCIGHVGHIALTLPVFHIGFFKEIVRVLQQICKSCGRVLLSREEKTRFLRLLHSVRERSREKQQRNAVHEKLIVPAIKRRRVCCHCGAHNGVVKKLSTAFRVVHELRHKDAQPVRQSYLRSFSSAVAHNQQLKEHLHRAVFDLSPLTVQQLFSSIPPSECLLLNFDPDKGRPQDLLITQLPVPPACIRPSVSVGVSGSNEDDLSVKLGDIVFINNVIAASISKGASVSNIVENWDFLQQQVAMYINADLPGFPRQLGGVSKPIRSLIQRLKGKQGRFRGNLSGKRVDFSSRTVISPDPNLRIDEVGVPELVAKTLTFPERVTAFNLRRLRAAVLNGCELHPGANTVELSNGLKMSLKYGNRAEVARRLRSGDVVERHLRDGDVVLFNRQPSLHRLSIMAHRARVLRWRTFRFNESVCTPYNADFDGDEMNLHLPQTEEARAEALQLMGVESNMVTPRHGEPLVTATQDFITTAFLITQRDVFYDRSDFAQIAASFADALEHIDLPPPAILKPVRLWTGKQLMSLLLRPNSLPQWPLVNVELKERNYTGGSVMCSRDGFVLIRNSECLCGNWAKSTVGGDKHGLLYCLIRDHSSHHAAVMLNRLAKLSARWIGNRGFSFGIDDVTPSPGLQQHKAAMLRDGYAQCDELIRLFKRGELVAASGCNEEQTLEAALLGRLSSIREELGSYCLRELDYHHNSPLIMAVCGSKGSKINISQMISAVGQQAVNGNRIPNGFIARSLPHFPKQSREPAAKGFVENSFFSGLTATELFFHTMGGREGLVDTAVKTAETGYMQRRLMKALEDLAVQYDGTVRTSEHNVVQFVYGDDGLDPLMMSQSHAPVQLARLMDHVRATVRGGPDLQAERCLLPVEIVREVEMVEEGAGLWKGCSSQFMKRMKDFVLQQAEELQLAMTAVGIEPDEEEEEVKYAGERGLQRATGWHVINQTRRLTRSQLSAFFSTCRAKYQRARIEPGTAVGAIGAQSIGEPGTQMTLKSVDWAERVVVCCDGQWQLHRVGQWIDGLMGCSKAPAHFIPLEQVAALLAAPLPDEAQSLLLPTPAADGVRSTDAAGCHLPVTSSSSLPLIPRDFKLLWPADADEGVASLLLLPEQRRCPPCVVLQVQDPQSTLMGTARKQWRDAHALLQLVKQLEQAVSASPGWQVMQLRPQSVHSVRETGADVVVAFGATVQREWRATRVLQPVQELEEGISFFTARVLPDARALTVVQCPALHRCRHRQLQAAVLAAQRAAVDPSLLLRWAEQAAARRARVLAAQQAAASVYSNPDVQRVLEADAEMDDTRLLELRGAEVFAPSVSPTGAVSLSRVTAVTKHLPVNADGSRTLLRVRTRQGRVVSATKAKSFLTRRYGLLQPCRGDQLKVGDYLPVNSLLPQLPHALHSLDLRSIALAPAQRPRIDPAEQTGTGNSLCAAKDGRSSESRLQSAEPVAEAFVSVTPERDAEFIQSFPNLQLPELLPLDKLCGFFFGAFVAAGCSSSTQLRFSTCDAAVRRRLLQFVEQLSDRPLVSEQPSNAAAGWRRASLLLRSDVLAELMRRLCGGDVGRDSCIPSFAFSACDDFVRGFLDGFFSADSRIRDAQCVVTCSACEEVALGLQLLLTRFGVVSEVKKAKHWRSLPSFQLIIRNANVHRFARCLRLTASSKQAALQQLAATSAADHRDVDDKIPGCFMPRVQALLAAREQDVDLLAELRSGLIPRHLLVELLTAYEQSEGSAAGLMLPEWELEQLRSAVSSPVLYDQVLSITEVPPTAQYVYDLTVEGDRTFQLQSGLLMMDTFHFAGVASMNITLGVPRIKEVINAAKRISTPIITAPLVSSSDLKAARIVKGRIEKTTLGEVSCFIEEVYAADDCYLTVKLDLDAIAALQLQITADSVVQAILAHKKLKLKSGVEAKSDSIIRITPAAPEAEEGGSGSGSSMLFSMTRLKAALPSVVVQGVSNVNRAVINDCGDGSYNLLVEGYNLLGVMSTLGVRGEQCSSNHVDEMMAALGIEAARSTIIREIATTMEGHGMSIDYRHMALLADIMCYRGRVLGITRFGVAQMKESVLMLASFEKTADHLFEAAMRGVDDGIAGVSECIIMGTPIPVGTGLFQLLQRVEADDSAAKREQWKRSSLLLHELDNSK